MNRIYTIGETVLDIIFRNGQIETAMAGGAMLNTAVSLSRLHQPIFLLSEWGDDGPGEIIQNFLISNEVNTSFCKTYDKGNTSISIANIDSDGNATYTFYKNYPPQRFQITMPNFEPGDFVLFGSFFSIDPAIRPQMIKILNQAKAKNSLIIYDPNYRKNHLASLLQSLPFIQENIKFSHIIRGSYEDFQNIFGLNSYSQIFEKIQSLGGQLLIITHGGEEITLFKEGIQTRIAAAPAEIISTIGAGDAFNAGLIYELFRRQIMPENLHKIASCEWAEILSVASSFAADTCSHYENYISHEFAKQILFSRAK